MWYTLTDWTLAEGSRAPVGLCSASRVTLLNKLGAGLYKVNWTFRATVCLPSQPPERRSFNLNAASDLQKSRGQVNNGYDDVKDMKELFQETFIWESSNNNVLLYVRTVCFSLCVAVANCSTWSRVAARVTACPWRCCHKNDIIWL